MSTTAVVVPPIPWTPDHPDPEGGFARHRGFERFRVTGWIAPGEHDGLSVEVTEPVSREASAFLLITGHGHIRPGVTYTRLLDGRRLWMSDTHDEYHDHLEFIRCATGRVLIHGLGLGCGLKAILHKPEVEHVDVVERDERVLTLIGPYYAQDPRVNLIHGDALERRPAPGERWDVVWHDIWPDKNTDNLEEMATLHRRYGRRCGWQGSWSKDELVRTRRRERAQGWW